MPIVLPVRGPRASAIAAAIVALLGIVAVAGPSIQPAAAHSYRLGALEIGHIWAKPARKGSDLIVTGPVFNTGKAKASLVLVSSPAAEKTEMRSGASEGDKPVSSIAFPPGRPVSLAPWSDHVVLSGLKRDLKAGDVVELTLDFGPAGRKTVDVEIEAQASD